MKVIIIGGVAGGATCAARIRRLDEHAQIILLERGPHVSFANCGLPYYISSEIPNRDHLFIQSPEGIHNRYNIDVRVNNEAMHIDRTHKTITIYDHVQKKEYIEDYDKLVLSPGAQPILPPFITLPMDNAFILRTVPDADKIKDYADSNTPKHAVIIGGGFIGLELAENLLAMNIHVTIIEKAPQVMAPLDPEMACPIHTHLIDHGITLKLGIGISSLSTDGRTIGLDNGESLVTDMTIFAIGVKPDSHIAAKSDITCNARGAIIVNDYLQTNDIDIYAIGDVIETHNPIIDERTQVPLAGPANRQGRLAADNICGRINAYKGIIGTSVAKVCDITVACTGMNEKMLNHFNIAYEKCYTHALNHVGYYPGATQMAIKLLFDPKTGKILGSQIIGQDGVDRRIDVLASAIQYNATVFDLQEGEFAYAPPFGAAKDPVNLIGYIAGNIIQGDSQIIHASELLTNNDNYTIIDVRTHAEVAEGMIPNALHIELDQLRDQFKSIPTDKSIVIYCRIGLRGYIAERILKAYGITDVYNLSGGYLTYQM